MIKYFPAPDIDQKARRIAEAAKIRRDFSRIHFVRSRGSVSRRTLARCHTVPRVIQSALEMNGHYVIEVISENFDGLEEGERIKIIIHELMHIPEGMRGGFRHHDYVCRKNIEQIYRNYNMNSKN
ncbi:MAG: metallopeptidase [Candidatus Aenigmarchaeota archaeon]|nr:metallopeptidase [Candidatus Aenigmarchaeota archaeon]